MSDHAGTIATAVGKLNAGDVDGYVSTLYAPHAVFHGFPPAFSPDPEGITEFFRTLRAAVPDATISPQDMLVDGDRVVERWIQLDDVTFLTQIGVMPAAVAG